MTLLSLDLTSLGSIQVIMETMRARIGGTFDYLMNNAGHIIIMSTLDFNIEIAEKMYDINV